MDGDVELDTHKAACRRSDRFILVHVVGVAHGLLYNESTKAMGEENDGAALVQAISPQLQVNEECLSVSPNAGNGVVLVDVAAIPKR